MLKGCTGEDAGASKFNFAGPRATVLSEAEGSSTVHSYSRKPGFTATRLRPLARRREMTARPLLVFIRVRKP